MKHFKLHIVLLVLVLAGLISFVSFETGSSRGQSPERKPETGVKPTVLISERHSDSGSETKLSAFNAAAERNAVLMNELTWTFGGKQQHGWYLYNSLINQTLRRDDAAPANAFAASLAGWQEKSGLSRTGVLDEDTLMALISYWQGNRLKDRTYAQPNQLITPPISDFWDPERLPELRQVERETYAAYKRMVAAALSDPSLHLASGPDGGLATTERFLKILSAFRPREYQEQLRRQSPNAGSAGLAVNSPHFTGRALDVYVGGDPVDTKDSNRAIQVKTPVYQWLVRNADRFGFRPYFYEPWHWEYVGEKKGEK